MLLQGVTLLVSLYWLAYGRLKMTDQQLRGGLAGVCQWLSKAGLR